MGSKNNNKSGGGILGGKTGGVTIPTNPSTPTTPTKPINNSSGEITAGTPPVGGVPTTPGQTGGGSASNPVVIPAPVITMSVSDPDALENVKERAKKEAARRGRKSLRIPLATARAAGSGIAIPV